MASTKTIPYSTFTTKLAGLVGIPYASMTANEQAFIQTYLNDAYRNMYNMGPWLDVSPYGEARFAGNLLTYPNDLTQTGYWTASAVTASTSTTNPQFKNPCDGRLTATLMTETSATSTHSWAQSYAFLPSTNYQYSAYVRANGRNYVQFSVNDGAQTYTAFFNISTGVIGTYSATVTSAPTIIQQNNGYWLCTLYFTTSASAAGTGSVSTLLSTNGSTTSYAGNTSYGAYSWGNLVLQTTFASPTNLVIPWAQTGESEIDIVYQVWCDSPVATNSPRQQGYALTPDGIQLIGSGGYGYGVYYNAIPNGYTPSQFPVYLQYRKVSPNFLASDYSASLTYAVDDQVLYTNTSSNAGNTQDFYKCLVATTAGQSPITNPTSWLKLDIYQVFLNSCVYRAYGDWLRMDGQMDKALAADALSDQLQEDEAERQERQGGWVSPMKVQSHVTSQARR